MHEKTPIIIIIIISANNNSTHNRFPHQFSASILGLSPLCDHTLPFNSLSPLHRLVLTVST